jgi:branched-subunit amino acid transport protein
MKWELVWLVIGMSIVTYFPRMLPIALLQHVQLPPFVHRFFRFIPFAVLGALIFPGILSSTGEGNISAALAGSVVCIALAWFRANVMIVVLGGIVAVLLWQTL